MAKILYNPENGSTIADVIVGGTTYFSSKEGLEFNPEEIVKMDQDNVAEVILETFGFIQEVTVEQAKSIKDRKDNNKYKCTKCDYSTDDEKKLQGHALHHAKEEKIDKELGIRIVKGNSKNNKEATIDPQIVIDQEATSDGLIGDGLTRD